MSENLIVDSLRLTTGSCVICSQVVLGSQKLRRVSWHLWTAPVTSHWRALWIKKKRMWHIVGVHEGKRAMSFKSSGPLTTKRRLTRVQHGTPSATILTPSLPSSSVQVTKHLCPSLLESQNSLWPAARSESGPSSPEEGAFVMPWLDPRCFSSQ